MAAKFLTVDRSANFIVHLMGHHLFSYIDDLILAFPTGQSRDIPEPKIKAHVEKITKENLGDSKDSAIYMEGMGKDLENQDKAEGFFLYAEDSEKPVGRMWVMYRGGQNGCYRIRKSNAWIFNVRVLDEYRGRGCCGYMLKKVMEYLRDEKHIDSVSLAVARNNLPARRAYEKAGGG